MQVSQNTSNVNNAVIGAKAVQSFRIAETPEFFHILSSSLYSNPKFAVVRETLCNAWDAHRAAGIERPVEVTVTRKEFIVKDFGSGIAPEDMTDIYCVYGSSTKQNQEDQTGGFGLGCKAPFAYVNTFEVTSCYKGTKTIYSLSKTSIDTDGKPAISTLVQVPTDETGLTVTIRHPDTSYLNEHIFGDFVKELCKWTGQKVLLDYGTYKIEYSDKFYSSPEGFVITSKPEFIEKSSYYVRYGGILYPFEYDTYELETIYKSFCPWGSAIILDAPPNSLDITPSREKLQYSDKTKNTLNNLCERFIGIYKKVQQKAVKVAVNYWMNCLDQNIYRTEIHSFEDACLRYAYIHKQEYYLYALAKIKALQTKSDKPDFYHSAYKCFKYRGSRDQLKWMYKHILKGVNLKNIYTLRKKTVHSWSSLLEEILPNVPLAPLEKKIYFFKSFNHIKKDELKDMLLYKVTSKKQAQRGEEFFKSRGWEVNTSYLYFDKRTSEPRDKRIIPSGYNITSLDKCFRDWSETFLVHNIVTYRFTSLQQLQEFKYIFYEDAFSYRTSMFLHKVHQCRTDVAITRSKAAYAYCLKQGLKDLSELFPVLEEELMRDKQFISSRQNDFIGSFKSKITSRLNGEIGSCICNASLLFKFISKFNIYSFFTDQYISKSLKIPKVTSKKYTCYMHFCQKFGYQDKFRNLPMSKQLKKFISKIIRSNLCFYEAPSGVFSLDCGRDYANFIEEHILTRRN